MGGCKVGRSEHSPPASVTGVSSGSSGDDMSIEDGTCKAKEMKFSLSGQPDIVDWGYPNFLSETEFRVYELFREEVFRRDVAFQSTVFCFADAHEDEAYALCRWLRARKFNLSDTVQMVEEATECRFAAAMDGFYPDPHAALGVEPSIYISQYPQLYCGYARNGCPLFVSKPGLLNANGLECITTLSGILKYHWFGVMHDYQYRLRKRVDVDPDFKRYELVYVMDLNNLTTAQVSKRALNIVKVQTQVDSLCFPETMHRLIIINAPGFFTFTWKLVKNWVDARTAKKVEIFGIARLKWMNRLRELIDDDNLPSDYGGMGPSTDDCLPEYCKEIQSLTQLGRDRLKRTDEIQNVNSDDFAQESNVIRQEVRTMSVRSKDSMSLKLFPGESMRLCFFTRSVLGARLQILSPQKKKLISSGIVIHHTGTENEEEEPTRIELDLVLNEAGIYKLKMDSIASPFSTEQFLIVGRVFSFQVKIEQNRSSLSFSQMKKRMNVRQDKVFKPLQQNSIGLSHDDTLVDVPLCSPCIDDEMNQPDSPVEVDMQTMSLHTLSNLTDARKEAKSVTAFPPQKRALAPETTPYSAVEADRGGMEPTGNLCGMSFFAFFDYLCGNDTST